MNGGYSDDGRAAVEQTQLALDRAEAALRARPEDYFRTSVGHFWGLPNTRDYMRARFAAANALLEAGEVESALEHYSDMLRLCRSDNLGVRGIIPHLLLRLDREQECYDLIKWWAITSKDGDYDYDDITLPYLNICDANVFEPIDIFLSGASNLSHLVALTLLKLRLYLDLSAYESDDMFSLADPHDISDRPVGSLALETMQTMNMHQFSTNVETMKCQYRKLCQDVHDANPYFWEALVGDEHSSPPPFFSPGSKEEAALVLHQCQRAWQETEDALIMANTDTASFATVYENEAATASASNTSPSMEMWERKRGDGNVFPSQFKPSVPESAPTVLFPTTSVGQTIRFLHRDDRRKVLAYVDGACPNNGLLDPRAGWAVVIGTPNNEQESDRRVVSGRLEDKGPFGDDSVATSNRAELRAAIAALRLCDWRAQGYDSLVIATDSAYVVNGATGWAKGWVRNGWTTRTGASVKNKDLWDLLLGDVERWKNKGLRVQLWRIPREWNGDADAAAKQVAQNGAAEAEFREFTIGSSQTQTPGVSPAYDILALCLEQESLLDACFGGLVSVLNLKAKVERATTRDDALAKLTQEPPPSIILVTDGALTRQKKLYECVIDRLRGGGYSRTSWLFQWHGE